MFRINFFGIENTKNIHQANAICILFMKYRNIRTLMYQLGCCSKKIVFGIRAEKSCYKLFFLGFHVCSNGQLECIKFDNFVFYDSKSYCLLVFIFCEI